MTAGLREQLCFGIRTTSPFGSTARWSSPTRKTVCCGVSIPPATITTLATGFSAPVAVKGGPGNSLFVADGGQNAVFRLAPDGSTRRRIGRATGPFNLAVDNRGNVYVSELAGARRVLRIAPSGRVRVLVR